jgi:hypothetical protein
LLAPNRKFEQPSCHLLIFVSLTGNHPALDTKIEKDFVGCHFKFSAFARALQFLQWLLAPNRKFEQSSCHLLIFVSLMGNHPALDTKIEKDFVGCHFKFSVFARALQFLQWSLAPNRKFEQSSCHLLIFVSLTGWAFTL